MNFGSFQPLHLALNLFKRCPDLGRRALAITFDYAVEHNCNIMSWPLTMPFSEAEDYRQRLDDAIAKSSTPFTGKWALMRHTAIYKTDEDKQAALDAVRSVLAMFGNLMTKSGSVENGFPSKVPLETLEGNVRVDPEMLAQNLAFGTPEEVIEKLKLYQNLVLIPLFTTPAWGLIWHNKNVVFVTLSMTLCRLLHKASTRS